MQKNTLYIVLNVFNKRKPIIHAICPTYKEARDIADRYTSHGKNAEMLVAQCTPSVNRFSCLDLSQATPTCYSVGNIQEIHLLIRALRVPEGSKVVRLQVFGAFSTEERARTRFERIKRMESIGGFEPFITDSMKELRLRVDEDTLYATTIRPGGGLGTFWEINDE